MSDYFTNARTRRTPPSGYARRQSEKRAARGENPPELRKVIDPARLYDAAKSLRAEGGPAAGQDGVSPRDLSTREIGEIARQLSLLAKEGQYVASQTRRIRRKKPSGGIREIRVASAASRILSAAFLDALTPYADRHSIDASHGWRRGRDGRHLFGDMARAVHLGRVIFQQDDVRKCFDYVPVEAAVKVIQQHFGSQAGLAQLLEAIVRGHPSEHRPVGIAQGDSLSPLIVNLVLHHWLDTRLQAAGSPVSYLRYADNLVWLGASPDEVLRARNMTAEWLAAYGMQLKGEDGPPVDLTAVDPPPMLLGFLISAPGSCLQLTIPEEAWTSLEDHLAASHGNPDPAKKANSVFHGWITQYGPAIPGNAHLFLEKLRDAARRNGVREYDHLAMSARISHTRKFWQEFLSDAAKGGPM